LRAVWLDTPPDAMIFDEVYYVNAARVILGWPVQPDAPYANEPAGLDPNREHPPLGKLYIAASMSLFGDDAIGWRVPSIVAGTASIALVYAVARAAGGEAWLGVLAAGLFAFDNLVLVHSRIATLDMLLVAFMLLAAWCALRGWYAVGGVAAALAALVKVGGVYGVLALLIFEVLLGAREWWTSPGHRLPWPRLKAMSLILAGFLPVWLD
jgi:predicted membrane-bound dolichyl-phosphate-mannose-protein mannosyltransferase